MRSEDVYQRYLGVGLLSFAGLFVIGVIQDEVDGSDGSRRARSRYPAHEAASGYTWSKVRLQSMKECPHGRQKSGCHGLPMAFAGAASSDPNEPATHAPHAPASPASPTCPND